MMLDAETMCPYHDYLVDATLFDAELIEKYFHIVFDDISHSAMVTDGYGAYPTIIESFDMFQQRCVFYMMYNVGQEAYLVINRIIRANKDKYGRLDKNKRKTKENIRCL